MNTIEKSFSLKGRESELFPIVAKLAEKYTSKGSTSVSQDTAVMLMEAVCYCIHEAQEESQTDTQSQSAHSDFSSIEEVYEKGYALVCAKLKKTERLYKVIIEKFRAYENAAYYDTIIKGMPKFFEGYDPRFCPHKHILTLDYPVLADDISLCGIDRIYDYLLKVRLEQRFLNQLPDAYIRQCLEEYYTGYEELFVNVSQIVIRSMLNRMLHAKPLDLTESREALIQQLKSMLMVIVEQHYGGNASLYEYLAADMPDFAAVLVHSEKQ